jgi:hypothetical protein
VKRHRKSVPSKAVLTSGPPYRRAIRLNIDDFDRWLIAAAGRHTGSMIGYVFGLFGFGLATVVAFYVTPTTLDEALKILGLALVTGVTIGSVVARPSVPGNSDSFEHSYIRVFRPLTILGGIAIAIMAMPTLSREGATLGLFLASTTLPAWGTVAVKAQFDFRPLYWITDDETGELVLIEEVRNWESAVADQLESMNPTL